MKIFFATSFSSKIDSEGKVLPEFRASIEKLLSRYEAQGHEVFCAVRAENWRIAAQDPVMALKLDLQHIKKADKFVALLDEQVSAGVQLEIGYALALGKEITLLAVLDAKLGWTNQALMKLTNVQYETV